MSVERLKNALGNLAETKGVLAVLADRPVAQKQAELYPALPAIIVELVTAKREPFPPTTRLLFRFVVRELPHDPTLGAALFEALAATPPRHAQGNLHELYVLARDRRAIPLLRGGAAHAMWTDAVIALAAGELLDEVIAQLENAPTRDLAVACAHVGGARARDVLVSGKGDAVHPIGLALLANPDDQAYFAGSTPNRVMARRIHTALTARGPKQRSDALGELAKGLESGDQPAPVERLMACTAALADKRADVVERAAAVLAAHANAVGAKLRPVFFPAFLERASLAIANGVTDTARGHLATVHGRIPAAPPLGAAKTVEAPLARKAAAKKKGQEMLAAMQDARLDASNLRDAGIEAQIAADPDAAAPYAIYADWLQSRGDPRGQWIMLHTVKGLAAQEALDAFLRAHGERILGPLRPYVVDRPPVELAWHMGFVKRARFAPHAGEDVVRAVLDATCCAFIQELAFPDDALAAPVIALLREKRPPSLARLAFGMRDEPPAELVAVMPRLQRDPQMRWAAVLARLAELRNAKHHFFDLEDLPALVAAPGVRVDAVETDAILTGLKQECGLGHPIGLASAMTAVFTASSLDAFAEALVRRWIARGESERIGWVLPAAGALGGTRTARLLATRLPEQGATSRMIAICDQLRAIASRPAGASAAAEELVFAAFAPGSARRPRDAARATLAVLFPDRLDAGLARLAPWTDARALEAQRAWLESLMVEGRTLAPADFAALVGFRPRLADARTLLWSDRGEDNSITALFRLDEQGSPVRRNGTPYVPTGRIGLVHPAELSDAELDDARDALAHVDQAILQLARPIFMLRAAEAGGDELTRFVKRRVGFHPIANALRERGWYISSSETEDDGVDEDHWVGTNAFARMFSRDNVQISAVLNNTRGSIASVQVWRDVTRLAFDQLHVVTISELLWDLEVAHGWTPSEAPPRRVSAPSAARAAAIVERAKSGRAKCVVCTQPIAKDTLRIGVERMVETPTFRGMTTVWLHPACRGDVPELAGVDLEAVD